MNIAILSGKGGTGKTTVATNLASIMNLGYVDLDVEEPNGFIFLKPDIEKKEDVMIEYPTVMQMKCSLCKACVNTCQFHALAKAGSEIMVFEKLCHACGACKLICKENAIIYEKRVIGYRESGKTEESFCYRGVLKVGEPMATPIIRDVLSHLPQGDFILDCPPGTSCNVVNSIQTADAAIFVTEPSSFGMHDLRMAIELIKEYSIPYGVICNKDDGKENLIKTFCRNNEILFLGGIPYSQEAAELYSKGKMLYKNQTYEKTFERIAKQIREAFR